MHRAYDVFALFYLSEHNRTRETCPLAAPALETGCAVSRIQTVLVVDDSPEDRYAIRRALTRSTGTAYLTLEAATGADALALCRAQPVDCVLLDFALPDLDGVAVLDALRADETLRAIPVAMLTGMGNELVAVQALKAGAQEYLIKGRSSPDELCRTVGAMIERAALLRQLAVQQQALAQREAMFRTSVETMLDCFGIYSAVRDEAGCIVDFRVEYVNDAACANNQLSREQQIGRRLCDILPGHRGSELFTDYCCLVETGEPLVKESLLYADVYGGQYLARAFDIRASKWGDGFVAAWRDISERKRAELERVQLLERERSSRETAERTAAQLTQLHTLAAALTAAASVEQVLDEIAGHATTVLDANLVGIGLLSSDGLTVELTANSLPPIPGEARIVSVMAPMPLADAVRRNQLIVFETADDLKARYPLIAARLPPEVGAAGAVIPLAVNRQVLGALAIHYAAPRGFTAGERALLTTVGQLCAQALDRARRSEAERAAYIQLLAETGERARATAAVRASEARYRALTEACAEMIWRTSPTGGAVFVTSAWQELTGQSDEAMQGWGWTDAVIAEDREQMMKCWLRALAEGTPYRSEFRVRARDNTLRTLEARAVPHRDEDGTILEWVGLNIDITEQRRLAEQVARAAELMRGLPKLIAALEQAQSAAEVIALIEQQVAAAIGGVTITLRGGAFLERLHADSAAQNQDQNRQADGASEPCGMNDQAARYGPRLVLPLRSGEVGSGVLELAFAAPLSLGDADVAFLTTVADSAAHALTRAGWRQNGSGAGEERQDQADGTC